MSGLAELFGARSTFVLAALAVTWLAIVLLALIAANLHLRLVRLERASPAEEARAPFAHLLGRRLDEVLGTGISPAVRLAVVLASDCPSCSRILEELAAAPVGREVALLWRDGTPSPQPPLPPGVAVLDDGPRASRELGVQVTPFAVRADASGRIDRATPVGSVTVLRDLLADVRAEPTAALLHDSGKGIS